MLISQKPVLVKLTAITGHKNCKLANGCSIAKETDVLKKGKR